MRVKIIVRQVEDTEILPVLRHRLAYILIQLHTQTNAEVRNIKRDGREVCRDVFECVAGNINTRNRITCNL